MGSTRTTIKKMDRERDVMIIMQPDKIIYVKLFIPEDRIIPVPRKI